MGAIGYIYRTFRRLRAGKGFGVHSPFAYTFIKDVLRLPEKYSYYAYSSIDRLHAMAAENDASLLPAKYLKLIYRVAVYYNSGNLLVIGDAQPLAPLLTALKGAEDASSSGKHGAEDVSSSEKKGAEDVPSSGKNLPSSGRPIVVVAPSASLADLDAITLEPEPVYIVTDLKRNRAAWDRITSRHTACGMSFANPHIAVFVPDSRLPRQHFNIWL